MVKPNAQRDYYKDLEIKPTADENEVKKQYFKLGKQCCSMPSVALC